MKRNQLFISLLFVASIAFSCSKSEDPTPSGETPGPKFLAVKTVITSSCALSGCHVSPENAGGINFASDNNIISNSSQIKSQAVDMGTMPPTGSLSASEKAIITAWINAGGKLTD